ncbi:MAG: hypothetical protein JWR09_1963 [Mucilaginibacter sp.]|nr:hypothetical protein [Mucilaginibacter sp.]
MNMLSEIDENIAVINYEPGWRQLFKTEEREIKSAVNESEIWIEHIGSTAVTGLIAKPIIDIQLGISDWILLEEVKPILIALRYEYFGEAGVPGRHYFRKRRDNAFNVHVILRESTLWANNILIRNYLKNNKAIADEYGRLKLLAIEKGFNTLLAYSDHKNSFIKGLLDRAKHK